MTEKIKYTLKNLSWLNTLFLFLTPPTAIVLTILWLYFDGFTWGPIILGIIFYILSGVSITAGYHRLFSHRSYTAHPIVKAFFLIFGAAAFQNSVLKWASDHRIHHNQVDTEKDPYNINEGFFYAHMGWILLKGSNDFDDKYVKDLTKDPLIMFQHNHYFKIAGFFGIILPAILGYVLFGSFLGGISVGALLKVVLLHHSTFFINSLCHYIGNTPYTDSNSAKDSWFMALLTFGEGYHNFHHYFQTDYRNGIRWFQFDPTKWLIKVLAWFKLAGRLKKTPDFKIYKARLQMRLTETREKFKLDDKRVKELEAFKEKVIESVKHLDDTKKLYAEALKDQFASQTHLIELKRKIDIAKVEFRYNIRAFNAMLSNVQIA